MPKRRPMDFLRRLGARIRARRLYVNRTCRLVASMAQISTTQLAKYETGEGHPPAATLHRIAMALGTSSSALLGETVHDDQEQIDIMMKIHAHPIVGAILRHMQDMTPHDLKSLNAISAALARQNRELDKVEVMR